MSRNQYQPPPIDLPSFFRKVMRLRLSQFRPVPGGGFQIQDFEFNETDLMIVEFILSLVKMSVFMALQIFSFAGFRAGHITGPFAIALISWFVVTIPIPHLAYRMIEDEDGSEGGGEGHPTPDLASLMSPERPTEEPQNLDC